MENKELGALLSAVLKKGLEEDLRVEGAFRAQSLVPAALAFLPPPWEQETWVIHGSSDGARVIAFAPPACAAEAAALSLRWSTPAPAVLLGETSLRSRDLIVVALRGVELPADLVPVAEILRTKEGA